MSPRPPLPLRLLAAALLAAGGASALAQEVGSPNARVTAVTAESLAESRANEGAAVVAPAPVVARVPALPVASASLPRHWVTSAEWSGRSYRWSVQRGRIDIGLAFNASDPLPGPLDLRGDAPAPLVPTLPTISFGMQRAGSISPSSLLERALGGSDTGAAVSRVGIEWKPAQPQVNFLREGLGVRLDGNDRMTVRLRKGMLGIYMHHKF